MPSGKTNPGEIDRLLVTMYQALLLVPRGTGDHTDLCRMQNQGISPTDGTQCHCHVQPVRKAIAIYHSRLDVSENPGP